MKYKNIIAVVAVSMTLTSCGLYDKYVSKASVPANAYGTSQDIVEATNGASLAEMSWREFFNDPLLQQLIDSVIARMPVLRWRNLRLR